MRYPALDDERRESPTEIGDGGSCANRTPSAFADALDDIKAALYQHYLASTLSRQDIAQRYQRSRVGPFWLTINMGVQIAALGLVFGALFRAQLHEFLPFICVSLIFWGFISACLTEGCTSFIAAEGIILQVRMPLFTHVLRCHHRNAIILAHNLLILPLAFLLVGRIPSWHALLAIPGLLAIAINVLWMMLIFAVACTRYRDLTQIVQNAVQVLFFITPLMWMPRTLPEGGYQFLLDFNPFFHLISLVQAPLLGGDATSLNWFVAIGMAIAGWTVALWFYGKYRFRIAYWL